jgi:hypothetical protein
MELKKIWGKKSLKLLFLLLASLLVSSVSASVYYTMFMSATVGVSGNKVQFWPGTDFSSTGGGITNARQEVTFTQMNGLNGSKTTYTDPVNINNTDATHGYGIDLELGSWTGSSSTPLYNITITMYNSPTAGTKEGDSIVLVPGGNGQPSSTGNVTIAAGTAWRVQWDIWWNGTATAGDTVSVNLQLVVS